MKNLVRFVKNFLFAVTLSLPAALMVNLPEASAAPEHTMQYDQVIIHYGDGTTEVCRHCDHFGSECTDPDHTTIC